MLRSAKPPSGEVCDDQIRMGEKREQEKENSEAPQRNMKKKSDTPEEKSDTHERKFNYFAEASEVRKDRERS